MSHGLRNFGKEGDGNRLPLLRCWDEVGEGPRRKSFRPVSEQLLHLMGNRLGGAYKDISVKRLDIEPQGRCL